MDKEPVSTPDERHIRVSVICIFYNSSPFLAEAIESVLNQSFGDFELLLVDDGSSDGSTAIARSYADRCSDRVRYFEHPGHANRGMSATRNLGLRHAVGEFVTFIDSDDVWRREKLRDQVLILDANPRVGMVCGAVNYWSSWEGGVDKVIPTGQILDGCSKPPETTLALYPLGQANAPCNGDALIRRSVVEAVGGFEEEFAGMYEDQAFFSKVYLETPVWFSQSVWFDYRQHKDSCLNTVMRSGQYGEYRRAFLDWFVNYLSGKEFKGRQEVLNAAKKARWHLDHPLASRIVRRLRRDLGKIGLRT